MSYYRVIRRNASVSPWTPLLLGSTLRAWYDFSDSSTLFSNYTGTTAAGSGVGVRRINDKSGNGFYLARDGATGLTRVVGAVNGRDILRATGSGWINTELRTPFGSTTISGLTVVHARKTAAATQPDSVDWSVGVNAATTVPSYSADARMLAMQGRIADMPSGPSGWTNPVAGFQHWNDGLRFPAYVAGVPRDSSIVMASRLDGTALTQRIWVNGTEGTQVASGTNTTWDWRDGEMRTRTVRSQIGLAANQLWIGLEYGTIPLHGDLCEYLFCDSALSESDRQKAEGYLAHRWGSAASLPQGHPYRSAAPTA